MPKEIWPMPGIVDTELNVPDSVYNVIQEAASGFARGDILASRDGVFEIARRAIQADRVERETRDRHARGDFNQEIRAAIDAAREIYDRTDAAPCELAGNLKDMLTDMLKSGFNSDDVGILLAEQDDLENELATTTELAVKLHGLILSLKGVNR